MSFDSSHRAEHEYAIFFAGRASVASYNATNFEKWKIFQRIILSMLVVQLKFLDHWLRLDETRRTIPNLSFFDHFYHNYRGVPHCGLNVARTCGTRVPPNATFACHNFATLWHTPVIMVEVVKKRQIWYHSTRLIKPKPMV